MLLCPDFALLRPKFKLNGSNMYLVKPAGACCCFYFIFLIFLMSKCCYLPNIYFIVSFFFFASRWIHPEIFCHKNYNASVLKRECFPR